MRLETILPNDGLQVDIKEAFCISMEEYPDKEEFTGALILIDEIFGDRNLDITLGAVEVFKRRWYQRILAASAWNWSCETGLAPAVTLPNKMHFDITSLYEPGLKGYMKDLRSKVLEDAATKLNTSNPDFVLVDTQAMNIKWPLAGKITHFDHATLDTLDTLYECIVGRCDLINLRGFMSVRTSFRPDLRLQIPYGGSLMKAIYAHLQTRDWINKHKEPQYYTVAMEVWQANREAARKAAIKSITDVNKALKDAVGEVFIVNSEIAADVMWNSILVTKF